MGLCLRAIRTASWEVRELSCSHVFEVSPGELRLMSRSVSRGTAYRTTYPQDLSFQRQILLLLLESTTRLAVGTLALLPEDEFEQACLDRIAVLKYKFSRRMVKVARRLLEPDCDLLWVERQADRRKEAKRLLSVAETVTIKDESSVLLDWRQSTPCKQEEKGEEQKILSTPKIRHNRSVGKENQGRTSSGQRSQSRWSLSNMSYCENESDILPDERGDTVVIAKQREDRAKLIRRRRQPDLRREDWLGLHPIAEEDELLVRSQYVTELL